MEQNQAGYKRAAAHFGLSPNTVKTWQRVARDAPEVTPEVVKPLDHSTPVVEEEGRGKGGDAPKPPAESRARPSAGPRIPAALLSESARSKLRTAVEQQLDFLSDPDTISDQKGRADAARALQTLLAGTPDILTFDERTNGRVDDGGTAAREDAARRVRAALDPNSSDRPGDGR